MNHDEQQERIDDYLNGRLSDPEAFERELQAHPQTKNRMEATRRALDAINISEHQRLKDRLRQLEDGREETSAPPPAPQARVIPIRRGRKRRWFSVTAAIALLLFLAGYFILSPDGDNNALLAAREVEPYPATVLPEPATPRAAAYRAYASGDYERAVAEFSNLDSSDPVDEFYLAQSLLAGGSYPEAADIFTGLSERTGFQLAAESAYYRAVAHLGAGDWVDAKAQLSRIADTPNHPSREAAERLLDKI